MEKRLARRGRIVIETVVALMAAACLVGQARAQVKYTDERGVTHYVGSAEQVPDRYRSGATRPDLPPVTSLSTGDGGASDFQPVVDADSMERRCKAAILARLKSPASASFPDGVRVFSRFKAGGKVDAQNSYGALVRSFAWCEFSLTGSQIERVSIDN